VEVELSPLSQKVQLNPLMWFYYDYMRGLFDYSEVD